MIWPQRTATAKVTRQRRGSSSASSSPPMTLASPLAPTPAAPGCRDPRSRRGGRHGGAPAASCRRPARCPRPFSRTAAVKRHRGGTGGRAQVADVPRSGCVGPARRPAVAAPAATGGSGRRPDRCASQPGRRHLRSPARQRPCILRPRPPLSRRRRRPVGLPGRVSALVGSIATTPARRAWRSGGRRTDESESRWAVDAASDRRAARRLGFAGSRGARRGRTELARTGAELLDRYD